MGFTASFVGLLSALASLCCANPCKALRVSPSQPKGEIRVVFSVVPSFDEHLKRLKSDSPRALRESSLSGWVKAPCHSSRCFQVDDFTISILDWMKRNCTVSICNPPDVVSSYSRLISVESEVWSTTDGCAPPTPSGQISSAVCTLNTRWQHFNFFGIWEKISFQQREDEEFIRVNKMSHCHWFQPVKKGSKLNVWFSLWRIPLNNKLISHQICNTLILLSIDCCVKLLK